MYKFKRFKPLFLAVLAACEVSAGAPIFIGGLLNVGGVGGLMNKVAIIAANNSMGADSGFFSMEGKEGQSEAVPTISSQKYVVQKGDTFTIIARKFKVLEKQIKEANGFDSGDKLAVNQEIVIPGEGLENYEGVASWYGPGFHGKVMANGDTYDQHKISVAHRTFPLGSKVKITNLKNGKTIVAPVLDRGPYIYEDGEYTRDIDMSYAAAKELGMVGAGLANVKIEKLADEIAGDKKDTANAINAGKEVKG